MARLPLSEIPIFAATNQCWAAQFPENSPIRKGLSADTRKKPAKNAQTLPK
jgi:hypothetical protein